MCGTKQIKKFVAGNGYEKTLLAPIFRYFTSVSVVAGPCWRYEPIHGRVNAKASPAPY